MTVPPITSSYTVFSTGIGLPTTRANKSERRHCRHAGLQDIGSRWYDSDVGSRPGDDVGWELGPNRSAISRVAYVTLPHAPKTGKDPMQDGGWMMTRWLVTSTLLVLFAAGCTDKRSPTVRGTVKEADSQPAGLVEHPDMFHSGHGSHTSSEALGPEVELGPMFLTAPEGWTRKPPQSGFVLAEFRLPRAEGDPADARLTVTAVGGSIEENVARWRNQFGGKPEQEKLEEIDVTGIPVTLVDFSGTYNDQHMGLAPAEQRPDYRMLAAIFNVGSQQFIIKCYGPKKTVAEHADEFLAFVRSLESPQDETTKPDAPTPDTSRSDTPRPEGSKPEAPKPDTPKPESPKPEAAGAEGGAAQAEKPEAPEGKTAEKPSAKPPSSEAEHSQNKDAESENAPPESSPPAS